MKYKGHDYGRELELAVHAARAAGTMIAARAGAVDRSAIREKGLNDLVTDVDEAAQRLIIRTLRETFPGYAFLAEEGDEFAQNGHYDGHRWIIDPIDGTTNFMHGVPPYAVSIGLQLEEELVLGVVLDVSRDELFTAVRGNGLFLNGERRHTSLIPDLAGSLITTGFPYRAVGHLEVYLHVLSEFMRRSQGVRRPGSAAVDLAYVAVGRFDGFFETGLKPWDVAAGLVLVEEGGGRVTDYRDRQDPLFSSQLIASNGLIHGEMLAQLEAMQDVYL
ncbi:MAG: inositol monophosphatase family protein [Rhodothermales bacterium]